MKIHWGTAIVLFFAVFLSLAGVFIVFALRQNNDLVTDDYYEQGAHFSQTIELKKRSFDYKDSVTIVQNKATIAFAFCPSIVAKADSFSIHCYCGSNRKNDFVVTHSSFTDSLTSGTKVSNPAIFECSRKLFKKSFYTVQVSWWVNSLQYEVDKEVIIQ